MKTTYSTEIRCSAQHLWTWIEDPERNKQWLGGLEEIRPVSPGPRRAGYQAKLFLREGRRLSEYDETILDYDPPRRLKLQMQGGCLRGGTVTVDYRLTELEGRTRLDYECSAEMQGFLRLFAPLFAIFGRMQVRSFFRKLKQLAEADGAALAAH
jgi:carbon monoxide dehydrogenase subunit G